MIDWLANSVQLGSVYAALGAGFCLYFGAMRLINLSHGDVFTIGAFVALVSYQTLSFSSPLAGFCLLILSAGLCGAVLGPAIEFIAYRHLRGRQPFVLLLTSVAISIVLREGLATLYPDGANPHPYPDLIPQLLGELLSYDIRAGEAVTSGILLAASAVLVCIVRWTSLGRKMRAVAQDAVGAALLGINVDRIVSLSFALASIMACVSGCLYGLLYGVVKYDMGLMLGLRGFAAAALGGIHRIEGGIIGGVILAGVELGVARLLPGGSGYRDVVVFVVLLAVLAIRPQGILGHSRRDVDTSLTRAIGFEGTR